MKKVTKRTKTKSKAKPAAKRAGSKSKTRSKRPVGRSKTKTTKATRSTKSQKTIIPKTRTLKRVATKAAVAAGLAAIGTALSELNPEQKTSEGADGDETERKPDTHRNTKQGS